MECDLQTQLGVRWSQTWKADAHADRSDIGWWERHWSFMRAIAVGASERPALRMRSTRSMKLIVSYTRLVSPNSSGHPRQAARVKRLLTARSAGLRFGVTTRKPVPPFGSFASVPWTTLISVHRTFTFSRPPSSLG